MKVADELKKRGLDLDDSGDDWMILCPFHTETDPSCGVHKRKGIFHCFACGVSGGFWKLLAEIDGVSEDEARQSLDEKDRLESALEELDEELYGETPERQYYYDRKSFCTAFSRISRTPGERYMIGRGIMQETMRRFGLRWGGYEGKWGGRVIMPVRITEPWGKLLSYRGRAVEDVKPKNRAANRYANQTLYGLYELLNANQTKRFAPLIVVEGEIDAMWMQQLGYAAVSVMGTADLTEHQLAQLMLHARRVVLSYDGDDAGTKATRRAVKSLEEMGIPTFDMQMPNGNDPNGMSPGDLARHYQGLQKSHGLEMMAL